MARTLKNKPTQGATSKKPNSHIGVTQNAKRTLDEKTTYDQPPTRTVDDLQGAAGLERDYERLYPHADHIANQCNDEARVWHAYNEEAERVDNEMLLQSGDALDTSLIFGALFSGVITTFVSQTSNQLPRDNAVLTVDVLVELSQLIRAQIDGTNPAEILPVDTNPSPESTNMVWVNGLWFTSLVLSVATALFAVLAKQWLRHYSSPIRGWTTLRERAIIHQYRSSGFAAWRVEIIIGLLPILLHLSLLLFLAGLYLYLEDIHPILSRAVGGLSLVVGAVYSFYLVTPIFVTNCPYQMPFTTILRVVFRRVTSVILLLIAFILYVLAIPILLILYYALGVCNVRPDWFDVLPMGQISLLTPLKYIFDRLKDWSTEKWTVIERRNAGLKDNAEEMALSWLLRASSNISAQRVAWQAVGTLPSLTARTTDRLSKSWLNSYRPFHGPKLNRAFHPTEELLQEAERWICTWIRLGAPADKPHTAPVQTTPPSDIPSFLTEHSLVNIILSWADDEPFYLLYLLHNSHSIDFHPRPRHMWNTFIANINLPTPQTNPALENDAFLDFVARSARCEESRSADEDSKYAILSIEEAFHDHLKERGWFEDPRVVARVARLHSHDDPDTSSLLTPAAVPTPSFTSDSVNAVSSSSSAQRSQPEGNSVRLDHLNSSLVRGDGLVTGASRGTQGGHVVVEVEPVTEQR